MDIIFTFIIALIAGVSSAIMVEVALWVNRRRKQDGFKEKVRFHVRRILQEIETPTNENAGFLNIIWDRQIRLSSRITHLKHLVIVNHTQLKEKEFESIIFLINNTEKGVEMMIREKASCDNTYYDELLKSCKRVEWLNIQKEKMNLSTDYSHKS